MSGSFSGHSGAYYPLSSASTYSATAASLSGAGSAPVHSGSLAANLLQDDYPLGPGADPNVVRLKAQIRAVQALKQDSERKDTQIRDLSSRLAAVQSELQARESLVEHLQRESRSLSDQLRHSLHDAQEQGGVVQWLRQELVSREAIVERLSRDMSERDDRITLLNRDVRELRQILDAERGETADRERTQQSSNRQLIQTMKDEHEAEVARLQRQIDELTASAARSSTETATMSRHLTDCQARLSTCEQHLHSSSRSLGECRRQLTQCEGDRQIFHRRLQHALVARDLLWNCAAQTVSRAQKDLQDLLDALLGEFPMARRVAMRARRRWRVAAAAVMAARRFAALRNQTSVAFSTPPLRDPASAATGTLALVGQIRKATVSMTSTLTKQTDLISFLESRVAAMQDELLRKQSSTTHRVDALRAELEECRATNSHLSEAHASAVRELSQKVQELATKDAVVDTLRMELGEIRRRQDEEERQQRDAARARLEMQYLRSAAEQDLRKVLDASLGIDKFIQ